MNLIFVDQSNTTSLTNTSLEIFQPLKKMRGVPKKLQPNIQPNIVPQTNSLIQVNSEVEQHTPQPQAEKRKPGRPPNPNSANQKKIQKIENKKEIKNLQKAVFYHLIN